MPVENSTEWYLERTRIPLVQMHPGQQNTAKFTMRGGIDWVLFLSGLRNQS